MSFEVGTTGFVLGILLILIFLGVDLAVALGITSLLGLYVVTQSFDITINTLARTSFEGLRGYVFAALPLFMLMGEFISRSGAARDLYLAINRALRRLPGRLALATVIGNAVFAFLTGVSLAAAAAFTRFAYPEMRRFGYDRSTALGIIAGSSCLGMLIPPSNLMILWGILVEESIGRLFLAGIVPGLILTFMFGAYVFAVALGRANLYGEGAADQNEPSEPVAKGTPDEPSSGSLTGSVISIIGMVVTVLGGIWVGLFTPTEAAGVGTLLALVFGVIVKGMRWPEIVSSVLSVGRLAGPLMIMVLMALLFSRVLALTGIGAEINSLVENSSLPPWGILSILIGIWFLLGMFIDSKSIMLLTVPLFAPIGAAIGYDPIAFAIIGILSIETGLLTPPFGIIVYAVRVASEETDLPILSIFRSVIPFWIILIVLIMLIVIWPELATGLGDAVMG